MSINNGNKYDVNKMPIFGQMPIFGPVMKKVPLKAEAGKNP